MSVTPITKELNTSTPKPLQQVVPQQQPASLTVQASVVDSTSGNKVSSVNTHSLDAGAEHQQSDRSMNHVLTEYDRQGKVRTKFIDSNSDVVYQIPTEMVSKLEDQMATIETPARTKG